MWTTDAARVGTRAVCGFARMQWPPGRAHDAGTPSRRKVMASAPSFRRMQERSRRGAEECKDMLKARLSD